MCREKFVRSSAALLCALSITGGTAYASDTMPVYDLAGVVVTATRTENRVKDVPASTQVISAVEIERNGSNSVRDLLSQETNIFQKFRTRGGGHDIVIRGMDTDKTLVLINGRRVSNEADASGLGNAMALDRVNLSDIERIEIVRGPSSALYGSEAMGGVINIITKSSDKPSVIAGVSRSTLESNNWYHFDTGRKGKISATADMRFNKVFRDKDYDDFSSNNYGTAQTYNLSLNYYLNDDQYLNLFYDYYSQSTDNDQKHNTLQDAKEAMSKFTLTGKYRLAGTGSNYYQQRNYGISYNGRNDRNDWQIRLYGSNFDWEDIKNPVVLEAIPGRDPMSQKAFVGVVNSRYGKKDFNINTNHLWAVEGRDTLRINENNRLTFGAEYVKNKITGTNLGNNGDDVSSITRNGITKESSKKNIDTYAAYIQNEWTSGKWFVVPALRYDHHSSFGSHVSPKLGVTYKVSSDFRIKANYGEGFKAPSVYQLYYSLDRIMGASRVRLIGNPDLDPEESKSFDIGVEGEFGKGYATLTYFNSRLKNLIDTHLISEEGNLKSYEYINIGKARMYGVENVIGYRFNDNWQFKVTSAWLSAKDTTNNTDLVRRAKFTQIYQLVYDDNQDTGYSATLWDQFDHGYITEEHDKKNYNLLNLTVTRKFNRDTRLYGTVENIFDKKDKASDLDGRYWLIGMEHRF